MASVALCVVAGGAVYERYAFQLFASAADHFRPADEIELVLIPGEEGWPDGTMLRPHRLLEQLPRTDYVYMIDADMVLSALVGEEILPPDGHGIVATLHPGFVGRPPEALPFETRPESFCFVPPERRKRYFCGGFWGGSRAAVAEVAQAVAYRIDWDKARGIVPVWHDESALNAALVARGGPDLTLSPAYCCPDSDAWYRSWWPEQYERKIVAIDKTVEERGER